MAKEIQYGYHSARIVGGPTFTVGSEGVATVGIVPSPVPGFYFLAITFEAGERGDGDVPALPEIRFLVSPATVVIELTAGVEREAVEVVKASPLMIPTARPA